MITVTRLLTTPIKGTRIQEAERIALERSGARGDRAFCVIDERGRMLNGKNIAALQTVIADYDPDGHRLELRFADGSAVAGAVEPGATEEIQFFSKRREARAVLGPFSDALSAALGRTLRLVEPVQGAVDRGRGGAASVISRGSLRRLAEVAETDAVDPRRFRMLIEIDGVHPHEEDGWVRREVRVGEALLRMTGNIGRCLITSRDAETAQSDLPTLDLLGSYRRELESTEPLPFGIHGAVLEPGAVCVGDPVTLQAS